ncbi:MAG: endospore germination permease [Desulfosporosinus sp.]|nr:endospore germination permease [Desulfosporosinus sp.]
MEKISTHQFMTLGAAILMGITFLPVASNVTRACGRDGWMTVLPGFAVGIPYGLMVLSISAQYPRQNLLQISATLLGKWIGKIIGCSYILISSYFGGLLLAQVGEVFQRSIMPFTPRWLFCVGGLLLVLYLVSAGIEVLARFSEVIFPIIVIALVLNITLSMSRIEQGELLPILTEGLKPLFFGMFKVIPFAMSYIFILAGILAFLPVGKQELGQLKTGLWRAVFLVGVLDMLVALIQILVFGPSETVRLVYGLLVLGEMVQISQTVSGVESLFMGVWLGAWVIKISAFFFAAIWGLETVFRLQGLKWKLVVSAVFLGITFGFVRGPSLIMEIGLVEVYVILPFTSVWVLTLWGASRWKKETGVLSND